MKRNPVLPAFICSVILFSIFEVWYLWSRSGEVDLKSINTKSPVFEQLTEKKAHTQKLLNQKYQNHFSKQVLTNQWNFVFVGYTACPDICPMTLSVLSQVFNKVEKMSIPPSEYKSSFISVDFEKMNINKVEKYAKNFHEKIEGVMGPKEETDIFLNWLGASYSKSGKLISHSTSLYLINPYGELVGEFVNPSDPKAIAEKFTEIYRKNQRKLIVKNFRSTKIIPGSEVIAGFVDIKNNSSEDIIIKEVSCLNIDSVEMHDMVINKKTKTMTMAELKELVVPKNSVVSLKRKSKHLMIYLKSEESSLKELNCFFRLKDGRILGMQGLVGSEI